MTAGDWLRPIYVVSGLIALIVLPLFAPVILLAPELIRVVLGPHWQPAIAPFQILAIGMLFRTSYKISDSIARSTGAVYRRAWRQVYYALFVVIGAWIGQHWGIAGVAWGTFVAPTFNFFLDGLAELRRRGNHVAGLLEGPPTRPAAHPRVVSVGLGGGHWSSGAWAASPGRPAGRGHDPVDHLCRTRLAQCRASSSGRKDNGCSRRSDVRRQACRSAGLVPRTRTASRRYTRQL